MKTHWLVWCSLLVVTVKDYPFDNGYNGLVFFGTTWLEK